ncbi:unnamed protein product [Rotaria sordida]|uniref:Uncharacterized protein n=1 Tax=Rotaria sordida TaxID=392033 RepID=A0A814J1P1_9BILA|nr:unnamed protein product [Rotaria sordida]CAF1029438.1 unnamed protein product [Rotaria sordida]CAF1330500.1 unnamed protein product [Rotaria sordida]CAF3612324.1 unnamed protein product [Rotaria sordida]
MKYKQLYPKSARSTESSMNINHQRKRCLLCDSLLKSHRYLLMGKSIQESIIINNNKTITYAECCQKYLKKTNGFNKLHIICLKCCDNLQHLHSLHLDAEELTKKLRQTSFKTKRLNHIRHSHSKIDTNIEIKEESLSVELVSESVISNNPYIHYDTAQHMQVSNIPSVRSAFVPPPQIFSNEHQNYLYHHSMNNVSSLPYAQFLIESPMSTNFSHQQQENDSNNQQLSLDDDRSLSPCTNDDENGSKNTRLTRRQYEFLTKLPDQQSLNAFIEASSSESNSRWTWRRTSANSRGYKIYYVCNFSMRRHYHPCPAAMYALFNPEGTISIYAHGQHQHIPKNRLPLSITDESKDEIFKCLQTGMSSSDIREHLIRLQLPFGDTKKLNNFIKYHKELLRFGAVTNVRLNGSAYRQPQFWAIRRTSPTNTNTTVTL